MTNNTKKVVVFDFDGTLTRTDTVKFLIISLLFFSPWKIIYIIKNFYSYLKKKLPIQKFKEYSIGYLIIGIPYTTIEKNLIIYKYLVNKSINNNLYNKLVKYEQEGYHIIIATASPAFAIKPLLKNIKAHIIGSEYKVINGKYSSSLIKESPYKNEKLIQVKQYLKSNNYEYIDYAFSDNESDMPLLKWAKRGFLIKPDGTLKLVKSNENN